MKLLTNCDLHQWNQNLSPRKCRLSLRYKVCFDNYRVNDFDAVSYKGGKTEFFLNLWFFLNIVSQNLNAYIEDSS